VAARRLTTVTCADDMHRLKGYKTLEEFIDHVQDQTDLEVSLEVEDDCVCVMQESPYQKTFTYPFEVEDIADWTYHSENDNTIRYDVHEDVATILNVPVYEDETDDEERAEELKEERTERVLSFVEELLHGTRWIDLEGTDLLIMDPRGGPLELTATFEWVTPTFGQVTRPFRPADGPAVARLYCDGRLAIGWPSEADDPPIQDGVERPLKDLVVVDLAIASDPLDLYDVAHDAFWKNDEMLARVVWAKLSNRAKSLFSTLMDAPEQKLSGKDVAEALDIPNGKDGTADLLAWAGRHSSAEERVLPCSSYEDGPVGGSASYWMTKDVAALFRTARGN
jgi:Family of unknown function (DUF6416)